MCHCILHYKEYLDYFRLCISFLLELHFIYSNLLELHFILRIAISVPRYYVACIKQKSQKTVNTNTVIKNSRARKLKNKKRPVGRPTRTRIIAELLTGLGLGFYPSGVVSYSCFYPRKNQSCYKKKKKKPQKS